jgi:hypothetical protein
MKSKPVSATSAIALQRWLRPALTPVGANKDYAEFRQQLEGLDALLRGSHLETMAMDFAKAGAGRSGVCPSLSDSIGVLSVMGKNSR